MLKKPEPVAWVRKHPDGALTNQFLEDGVIEEARKRSGAWRPLITTDQAEAYKDACVREALEQAAKTVESRHKEFNVSDARYQLHKIHGKSYSALIRALITKE